MLFPQGLFPFPLSCGWPHADPVLAVVRFHIAKFAASTLEKNGVRKFDYCSQIGFFTEPCQGRFLGEPIVFHSDKISL